MKKNNLLIAVAFLLAGLFFFSSCYTQKKGIVPCPHGYNDIKTENPGAKTSELV